MTTIPEAAIAAIRAQIPTDKLTVMIMQGDSAQWAKLTASIDANAWLICLAFNDGASFLSIVAPSDIESAIVHILERTIVPQEPAA